MLFTEHRSLVRARLSAGGFVAGLITLLALLPVVGCSGSATTTDPAAQERCTALSSVVPLNFSATGYWNLNPEIQPAFGGIFDSNALGDECAKQRFVVSRIESFKAG